MLYAWEIRDGQLILCSLARDVAKCTNIILASLKQTMFSVSKESASTFMSARWQDKR